MKVKRQYAKLQVQGVDTKVACRMQIKTLTSTLCSMQINQARQTTKIARQQLRLRVQVGDMKATRQHIRSKI